MTDKTNPALQLAVQFHEAYERLAPSFGYETKAETREFDPDSANGKLMIAVCSEVRASLAAPIPVAKLEAVAWPDYKHERAIMEGERADSIDLFSQGVLALGGVWMDTDERRYCNGFEAAWTRCRNWFQTRVLVAHPAAPAVADKKPQTGVTPEMVTRFLGWKLPDDFSPDCGISFKREGDYDHPQHERHRFEPIGTNLLTADQARAMLAHVLATPPSVPADPPAKVNIDGPMTLADAARMLRKYHRLCVEVGRGDSHWLGLILEAEALVRTTPPAVPEGIAGESGGELQPRNLTRLKFFRDLTGAERFKVLQVFGGMPAGVTEDELNHSIERKLFDRTFPVPEGRGESSKAGEALKQIKALKRDDTSPEVFWFAVQRIVDAALRASFDGAPATTGALSDAARDVLAERQRQITAEGWTPEHDDEHGNGSMAIAAACYALADRKALQVHDLKLAILWRWTGWADKWFRPKDQRSNLIRSGALIVAEIERIDRAALRASAKSEGGAA